MRDAPPAAQVLATFDNGRVEAFLDMRTLTPTDMTDPVMAARIARRLRHFHAAPVSLPGVDPAQPELFHTIRKWWATPLPMSRSCPRHWSLAFPGVPLCCGAADDVDGALLSGCAEDLNE